MTLESIGQLILQWTLTSGLKLLIAIVILLISFRLLRLLTRKLEKNLLNKHLDKTLVRAALYLGSIAAKALIVVCLVGYIGIDTSGITALIASLGVCAGLAVNGALANMAGGILLLITRPFRVDDYIEVAGSAGIVEDIFLCNTKIRTMDNKVIYIPNGTASSTSVINYTEKDTRRVDLTFTIAYSADFPKAKAILESLLAEHPLVLADPAPMVRMSSHGESSIGIVCRGWVKTENYWDVYFDMLEGAKREFDENGIEIPFNQLDVHLRQD